MKISPLLAAALAGAASALPSVQRLDRRQTTQNDLEKSSCKKVTLVFARASTEMGNMGESMGPAVCSGLKKKFPGGVACQGVGGPYSAGLADNVAPSGTSQKAWKEAQRLLELAVSKCPETALVAGGYSQGTAVMMNAISKLDAKTRNRVVGVVLFGYTKNGQEKSGIPNYPIENVKVLCAKSDGVCWGKLNVTAGHFSYMLDGSGKTATDFLVDKINNGSKGGSKSSSDEGGEGGAEAPAPKPKSKGARGKKGKAAKTDERVSAELLAGPFDESE